MNIYRIWFWIAFVCLMSGFSTAQRHEIGVSVGGVNYIGEIGSTQYIQPRHLEVGIIYKRNFNDRIGIRAIYSMGKLSGNDEMLLSWIVWSAGLARCLLPTTIPFSGHALKSTM